MKEKLPKRSPDLQHINQSENCQQNHLIDDDDPGYVPHDEGEAFSGRGTEAGAVDRGVHIGVPVGRNTTR